MQGGYCSVAEVVEEVRQCQRRGSGLPRLVLAEVTEGVRSVSEAKARAVLLKAGLGRCQWNVSLWDQNGTFLARPDGWFDAEAVAFESDSIEWHLSPASYKATQRRQARLAGAGVFVVPFAPSDVDADPAAFVAALLSALAQGRARPRPPITVVPAHDR